MKGRHRHQADTLGHFRKGLNHWWFGRCRCGWQSNYSHRTKEAALADYREHAAQAR